MDNGMHNNTQPDKARAPIINGGKEESALVQREYSVGSNAVDKGPAVVGDYSNLESSLHGAKMEDLPDELRHITDDVMPLSLLLGRLAQFSHMKLQELILDLASKPLPENALNGNAKGPVNGGINGNVNIGPNGNAKGSNVPIPALEDTSPESLDKKTMILKFIQDLHSRWVKALVITEWARNADEVGKLIDLRTHLAEKLELYNTTFWSMVNVKREMAFAKVPSPDLKTALEVLSTGAVHWMPDVGCNRPQVSDVPALTPFPVWLPAQTSINGTRSITLGQRNRGDPAHETATARVRTNTGTVEAVQDR
jgi:mediator of RNA polymerase II transcription subunit 14